MENYLHFKYLNNLINIGIEKSKIKQIEILKNKIIILLEENVIYFYDLKGDKIARKTFGKINYLTNYNDLILVLEEKGSLSIIDSSTLEISKVYELSDKPYVFCFFAEYNTFNLELLYCTSTEVKEREYLYEIVYYSKGYLFEKKKSLCKETSKIDKVDYQNGLLIWSSNLVIKILDLENKVMILRRSFQATKRSKDSVDLDNYFSSLDKDLTVDFMYINPYLILNIKNQIIIIYKIDVSSKEKISEMYRHDNKLPLLGYWFNTNLTKISLLQLIENKENRNLKLDIINISNKENILSKEFNYINSASKLNLTFSHKHSIVYVYNEKEIYVVAFIDKKIKIFNDLKKNDFIFEEITDHFNKLQPDEKFYISTKIVSNLKQLSKIKKNEKHISLIFNSVMTEQNFSLIVEQMINKNNLHTGFNFLKSHLNECKTKELKNNIIMYFLMKDNFVQLSEFINLVDLSNLDDSEHLEHVFYQIINSSSDEKKYDIFCCFSNFFLKKKNIEKAIECLIKIKHKDKIFEILLENKVEDLVLKLPEIFTLLLVPEIVTIIENIYFKIDSNLLAGNSIEKLYLILDERYKQILVNILLYLIETETNKFKLIPKSFMKKTIDYLINVNASVFHNLVKNIKESDDLLYIITTYKDKMDKDKEYWECLILTYFKIRNFKKILDIYIEKMKDPEKAVNFIESLNFKEDYSHITTEITGVNSRDSLYKYLQEIIENSAWLSSSKKFYFINIFHDVFKKDHNILIEDHLENDDLKFILLIFEQLQLKTKILNLTLNISKKNLGNTLIVDRKARTVGVNVNFELKIMCDGCKVNLSKYDKVYIFMNCLHCYHDFCFSPISELKDSKSKNNSYNKINNTSDNTSSHNINSTNKNNSNDEDSSILNIEVKERLACKICSRIEN